MTHIVLLVTIFCAFAVVYHLYKIKYDLDVQLKDLRHFQNNIILMIDRIEQALYQIDAMVSDIEDALDDNSTKFICKTDDKIVELSNTEVNSVKSVIDKDGKPKFMVNYYDVEYCINTTMFCDSIEIENSIKNL